MNYSTNVSKGYDKQWSAKTYIHLAVPNRQLKVSTFKNGRGQLYTSCQVVKIEPKSSTGFSGESFMMFSDYSANVRTFPEITRVNEKVCKTAHELSLTGIQEFIDKANEFYKSEEGKEVLDMMDMAQVN